MVSRELVRSAIAASDLVAPFPALDDVSFYGWCKVLKYCKMDRRVSAVPLGGRPG